MHHFEKLCLAQVDVQVLKQHTTEPAPRVCVCVCVCVGTTQKSHAASMHGYKCGSMQQSEKIVCLQKRLTIGPIAIMYVSVFGNVC